MIWYRCSVYIYIYICIYMICLYTCTWLKNRYASLKEKCSRLSSQLESCEELWLNKSPGFPARPYQPHQSLTPSQHMIKFRGGLRDIWRGRNLFPGIFVVKLCAFSGDSWQEVQAGDRWRDSDGGHGMANLSHGFWSIISFWDTKTMLIHKLVTPGNYH